MKPKSKGLVVAGASLALVGSGVGGAIAATNDTSPLDDLVNGSLPSKPFLGGPPSIP